MLDILNGISILVQKIVKGNSAKYYKNRDSGDMLFNYLLALEKFMGRYWFTRYGMDINRRNYKWFKI
jgi:hypothetical protein